MLRINQNVSVAGAKSYYKTSDYYTQDQERPGVWRGEGAKLLGLSGEVQQAAWERMCENHHPETGAPLTARTSTVRRVGWDFTFNAPKGLSLLYAETKNEKLVEVFEDAVDWTMRRLEAEVKVRIRKQGKNDERVSGNLAWGQFTHFTTRPVAHVPDPHLHVHCFAFNASRDPVENQWKAAAIQDIKRDAPYFEALFHAKLTEELSQQGLPILRTKKNWELAGLTPEHLEKFSRRTAEIEKAAQKLGITDPKAKDQLGAKTRASKSNQLTFDELQTEWRERRTPEESKTLQSLADRMGGEPESDEPAYAAIAVDQALEHLLARRSVVPERMVLARALQLAVGKASKEQVQEAFERSGAIRGMRDGRAMVTTRKVLGEEMRILKFAREGRGTSTPIKRKVDAFKRQWLNAEQKAAVRHVLQSRDRIMLLRGAAGVGKTSLMQEAVEQIQESGLKMMALAPSADASRGVLREAGFHEAETVMRFLLDEKLQQKAKGQVIWVDEASMLGAQPMARLFELADELNCRVLLTGDRAQHGSVDRGEILKLLETDAGLVPASVTEIQRQKADYKEAVTFLSEGDLQKGFEKLDRLGWIREVNSEDRERELAQGYLETIEAGKTALVISPTRAEGSRITSEIRRQLQAKGRVASEEREFLSLANLHRTEAERQDALSYSQGEVLKFHQNAKGYGKGDRIQVGESTPLPVDQAKRFTVFRSDSIHLAEGDLIRITANGRTMDDAHSLNNGSVYRVKGFDKASNIVLENGWKVAKDFGHLEYGYVLTSHASQGKTVDRVFIGESSQSFAAASREQFYVSVSRGKEQAVILTDSKEGLREAIGRTEDRLSATEFVNGPRMAQIRELNQRNWQRDLEHEPELEKVASYDR